MQNPCIRLRKYIFDKLYWSEVYKYVTFENKDVSLYNQIWN